MATSGDVFFSLQLPTDRIDALRAFVRQIQSVLGDRLASVALYGGAVRGDPSELKVAVVSDSLVMRDLRLVFDAVREARQSARIDPFFLTRVDLRRSTDVFPLRFLELRQAHVTLHGEDVLAGVDVSREHVRLACEQIAKTMLMQLRELYLANAHLRPALADALAEQADTLLTLLHTVLSLSGGDVPEEREALLAAAGGRLGFSTEAFEEILLLRTLEEPPGRQDLERLYGALMSATDAVATHVDQL